MPSITIDLTATLTDDEDDEATRLLAVMLEQNSDLEQRLDRPAIKRLIKRGVLKYRPFDD